MSSFTDTTVSPKRFRQLLSGLDINDNSYYDDFFNLFSWFRGDVRIGTGLENGVSQPVAVGPSSTTTQLIGPFDFSEEWEIMAIQVRDTAHIDIADKVEYAIHDNVVGQSVVLQSGVMVAGILIADNMSIFPNRDATTTVLSLQYLSPGALILRRKDKTTVWMHIEVTIKTTATVGNRSLFWSYLYRRRPVE